MRTLFLTLLLTSLIGGVLGNVLHGTSTRNVAKDNSEGEEDPCSDPTVYCGRLRVPGG
jgi:hypothetical protein